jgi:hypothetical protein
LGKDAEKSGEEAERPLICQRSFSVGIFGSTDSQYATSVECFRSVVINPAEAMVYTKARRSK